MGVKHRWRPRLRPRRETTRTNDRSVAEVRELQRDPEVVFLQGLDRPLQVVALLPAHAQLITLNLVLHALQAETLDVLADVARLVGVNADLQRDPLTSASMRCLFDLSVVECLQG